MQKQLTRIQRLVLSFLTCAIVCGIVVIFLWHVHHTIGFFCQDSTRGLLTLGHNIIILLWVQIYNLRVDGSLGVTIRNIIFRRLLRIPIFLHSLRKFPVVLDIANLGLWEHELQHGVAQALHIQVYYLFELMLIELLIDRYDPWIVRQSIPRPIFAHQDLELLHLLVWVLALLILVVVFNELGLHYSILWLIRFFNFENLDTVTRQSQIWNFKFLIFFFFLFWVLVNLFHLQLENGVWVALPSRIK